MQKMLVVAEDLVLVGDVEGYLRSYSLDDAREILSKLKKPLLAAVVPCQSAMMIAADQTVDDAAIEHFPKQHSIRWENLGSSNYQIFAIADELFERVRSIGKKVDVVPYCVAVRAGIEKRAERGKTGLRKLTHALTGASADDGIPAEETSEVLVVDSLQEGYLLTALRGLEVVAVRHVRGGNPIDEIQRTIAASRLGTPRILCTDREVSVELQAHGFHADAVTTETGILGWDTLEAALPLRFLNPKEIAARRQQRNRVLALGFLGVSLFFALVAAAALSWASIKLVQANRETQTLGARKAELTASVSKLYLERYASKAHGESVKLDNEILDLILSVPPQVTIISFEKTPAKISAVLERQAGAAPFGRDDLKGLLMVSPFFADAEIVEEFGGHLVRYHLTLRTPPNKRAGP